MTQEVRKKIGNTEIKISVAILQQMRSRLQGPEMKDLTNFAAANKLMEEFPAFKGPTLENYVSILRGSSDFLFGLAVDGKISFGMLSELSVGPLDMASRDTLTRIVMEKGMTTAQIAHVKRLIKNAKKPMSLHEAIQRASGEIPEHARPDHVKESMKTFGKLVGDLNDASIKFMAKLQACLDLLPHSAIANGESYLEVYEKIVTLENTLENSLGFTSSRKVKLFEALKGHIVAEAEMNQNRLKGES